jgi:predicted PurR-regulated permease PerM
VEHTENKITPIILSILGVFILFFYNVWDILPPFIGAFIFSYILSKPTAMIEKRIHNRTLATTCVLIPLIAIVIILLGLIIPAIQKQLAHLGQNGHAHLETLHSLLLSAISTIEINLPWLNLAKLKQNISDPSYLQHLISPLRNITLGIFAQGFELLQRLSMILIMPIITFYWLKDWPQFVQAFNKLIPKRNNELWSELSRNINKALTNFVLGQGIVCLTLAVLYSIGLSIVGLPHSILIGISVGFAAFIPYVGVFSGLIASVLIALFYFNTWTGVVNVLIVFAIIQSFEGAILSPRVLGSKLGINPAWIMFALFAGGHLFGFWGIMLAAPSAAILSVVTRFVVRHYRHSPWFLGQ